MKYILILCLIFAASGCDVAIDVGGPEQAVARNKQIPIVALPAPFQNWEGNKRYRDEDGRWQFEGSCVWATYCNALIWQNRPHTAHRFRQTKGNGECPEHFAAQLEREGERFAYTADANDVSFLEWSINTRRGCGVTVMAGKHMVLLTHLDAEWAAILDPNDISQITWLPRETFLAEWTNSNSWAVTPVYSPVPPL